MSEFDAFARFYDADYGGFRDDLQFYRHLAQRSGGPIIELMCGSGRVLQPLAADGHRLCGVDISGALLARAHARLEAAGLRGKVDLIEGDVRAAIPAGPFALAIVALNSFMHLLETEDQIATLRRIADALEPGGLLALDLFNPDPRELTRRPGELVFDREFALEDGTRVQKLVAQSIDTAAQINHVTFIYDERDAEGRVHRHSLPFQMRYLYRYELEHLLARCGFEIEAIYGSYDLDDFAAESEQMLTVASKRG